DALGVGLVDVQTPAAAEPATIALAYGAATLNAVAFCDSGDRVITPHARPHEVTQLAITALQVAASSHAGMVG
ncbi:hypothetical protein, partial [Frankia sp. Cr1]|uniref:hypothetical protein n=1 Tax=Frankia sp. Cr1 TaxID=3073931 RepID=UPI002AD4FF14